MTPEQLTKKLKRQTKQELIELLTELHSIGDEKTKKLITRDKSDSGIFFSPGDKVELLVLKPLRTALQCRILQTGEAVTFRKNRQEIPGETITVEVSKHWKNRNTSYISGECIKREFSILNMKIQPLSLHNYGSISRSECLLDNEHPKELREIYKSLFTENEYDRYEMETVTPGQDFSVSDYDPICESVDLKGSGRTAESMNLLFGILEKDFRCIDAYVHLGNTYFPDNDDSHFVEPAIDYYRAGIQMGEYFLGENFAGQLPWSMIDNRPYLRALHGYGLCLMRQNKKDDAIALFRKMLKYNPMDNQGVRFLLSELMEL